MSTETTTDTRFHVHPVVDLGGGHFVVITDPVTTLATYNAERSRGIQHTKAWQDAMAYLQANHDRAAGQDGAREEGQ